MQKYKKRNYNNSKQHKLLAERHGVTASLLNTPSPQKKPHTFMFNNFFSSEISPFMR
jgi:hypothetical protein